MNGRGPIDFEQRSRRLRRATTFLVLGVLVVLLAAALPTSDGTNEVASFANPIDEVWVLVCAALVFFMQAGFLTFEVGLARSMHTGSVALKNLIDWTVGSLAFFFVGFGLMFGTGDVVGTSLFALDGLFELQAGTISGPTFFLFQLAFAATTITLISGSLVERTSFLAYAIFAAVVGLVIYPVYGHWVWSGLLLDGNDGWLAARGFRDFAGGTVVHTTGAWAALVGVAMVGPRLGRFRANGSVRHFEPSSLPLTALGTLILWFGWLGFNGGSTLALSVDVPRIILVTNLCGVGGLVGAALFAYEHHDRRRREHRLRAGQCPGQSELLPAARSSRSDGATRSQRVDGRVRPRRRRWRPGRQPCALTTPGRGGPGLPRRGGDQPVPDRGRRSGRHRADRRQRDVRRPGSESPNRVPADRARLRHLADPGVDRCSGRRVSRSSRRRARSGRCRDYSRSRQLRDPTPWSGR